MFNILETVNVAQAAKTGLLSNRLICKTMVIFNWELGDIEISSLTKSLARIAHTKLTINSHTRNWHNDSRTYGTVRAMPRV